MLRQRLPAVVVIVPLTGPAGNMGLSLGFRCDIRVLGQMVRVLVFVPQMRKRA